MCVRDASIKVPSLEMLKCDQNCKDSCHKICKRYKEHKCMDCGSFNMRPCAFEPDLSFAWLHLPIFTFTLLTLARRLLRWRLRAIFRFGRALLLRLSLCLCLKLLSNQSMWVLIAIWFDNLLWHKLQTIVRLSRAVK